MVQSHARTRSNNDSDVVFVLRHLLIFNDEVNRQSVS